MTSGALVSICMPAYNARPFIGSAIDSVLRQDFDDWELLIVDDASTDGTWDIIRQYTDRRITARRREQNRGAEYTWNEAVGLATGRYVKLMCDDDELYPACLRKQVEVFEADRDDRLALVTDVRHIIDARGKLIMVRAFPDRGRRVEGRRAMVRCFWGAANLIGDPTAVMFRREMFAAVGGFSARLPYVIDLDLWFRLLTRGDLFAVDEPLHRWRVSGQAWTAKLARQQYNQTVAFLREYRVAQPDVAGAAGWLWVRLRCLGNTLLRRLFYRMHVARRRPEG